MKDIAITGAPDALMVGGTCMLGGRITPADATRNNLIWESSAPSIATIDKFGVLTAHQPGRIKISLYSWQDAKPRADNSKPAYSRAGISDSVTITIK